MGSFFRRAAFAPALRRHQPADLELHHGPVEDPLRPRRAASGCASSPRSSTSTPTPTRCVVDGKLIWIIDGYTTTDDYPYAQRAVTGQLPPGSGLGHRFNYVRNSVKAVVDAYDGTVTFYVVDPTDPLIQAYQKAFPNLFTDGSKMPDALRAHLRYPEDLFRVQTNMWGRYHIEDPAEFYSQSDALERCPGPGHRGRRRATRRRRPTRRAASARAASSGSTRTTCSCSCRGRPRSATSCCDRSCRSRTTTVARSSSRS